MAQASVYRFTPRRRIIVAILCCAILFFAFAGIYGAFVTFGKVPVDRDLTAGLILPPLTVGTIWLLIVVLTWRVTLTVDAIETSSWWGTRRLGRDEIAGCRLRSGGSHGPILVVVPAAAGRKNINLFLHYIRKDRAFLAWFSDLHNLNLLEMQQSAASIAANASFGATPEARLRRLVFARKIALTLDVATVVTVLWCFIWPQPYPLLIASLAALPALGVILVMLSRGLFRIGVGATQAHANLGSVCALPAGGIMARLLLDFDMVSWLLLIAASVACAVVFVVVTAVAVRSLRAQPWMLLGIGLVTGAYAFGAIGEANVLLDRSPTTVQRSQVLDKHINYGRAKTYQLKLAQWGSMSDDPVEASVPKAVYDRLEPGNLACVVLRSGALGMPWFIVLACR